MAKREEVKSANSKVTVLLLKLEGDDTTVREGIQTINQAITGLIKPLGPQLTLASGQGTPTENGHLYGAVEEPEVAYNASEADSEKGRCAKSQRIYRSPKILDELPMSSAKISLKGYLAAKKVDEKDSESRKNLAFAGWLKEQLNITTVTGDHIYTCFRYMNWHPAAGDVLAPIRAMKNQNGWFKSGATRGSYELNHVGEKELAEMAARP